MQRTTPITPLSLIIACTIGAALAACTIEPEQPGAASARTASPGATATGPATGAATTGQAAVPSPALARALTGSPATTPTLSREALARAAATQGLPAAAGRPEPGAAQPASAAAVERTWSMPSLEPPDGWPAGKLLALLYSANVRGEIEPCG